MDNRTAHPHQEFSEAPPGISANQKTEKSELKISKYSEKTGPLADNYSHWVAALEFVTKAVQLITWTVGVKWHTLITHPFTLTVCKDMDFSSRLLKTGHLHKLKVLKGYHLSIEVIGKGYFFCLKWYIEGKGLNLGWSLPVKNFVKSPPRTHLQFTLHSLMNFHMTPIRLIELLYRK